MSAFYDGYDFFLKNSGANIGSSSSKHYVTEIEDAILKLENDINNFDGYNTDADKLQGDIAEFWHADTYNIDAALNRSGNKAFVDRSHEFASPDVTTNTGKTYGLKYYHNASASAKAQAKSVFERFKEYQANGGKDSLTQFLEKRGFNDDDLILHDPIYIGQNRLIPEDQYDLAKEFLKEKISKEKSIRPEQVKRYQETLDKLCDRIRDQEGIESKPLSRNDAQRIAVNAKKGNFKAKEYDITTEDLLNYEYILSQALEAGVTAATTTLVLKTVPEIINAIQHCIDDGIIDSEDLKNIGFAAIDGAAEGFLRGTISAAITTACLSGLWGEAAKTISPNAIAMTVVIAIDTMKNSYKVAIGEMDSRTLINELVKETFIASVSYIVGSIMQSVLSVIPAFGFMLGSFVGAFIGGVFYEKGWNMAISFCIDSGFTMFGLVEQDYAIPTNVLKAVGIDTFEPKDFSPKKFTPGTFKPGSFNPTRIEPSTLSKIYMKRGLVEIGKIGYILDIRDNEWIKASSAERGFNSMSNTNKTEIVIVHSKNTEKEASLLNQLISAGNNDIISGVYTAKQYEDTKHTLSSEDYIVFIGYDKVIRKITNSIPATYHMYGMQYGWIGKQAHLWLDEAAQNLPVTSSSFDKYYEDKIKALKNGMQAPGVVENIMSYFEAFVPFLGVAKIKERRYTCLIATFYLDGLPKFIN